MKYEKRSISDLLRSKKTVFTFKDISLIWSSGDKKATIAGVNYYVKIGQLHRIRRGIYAKDKKYDRLELASRIFIPSYVSFETVLTQAGINFQFYGKITVASYQTREITVEDQIYSYKKIKDLVLTNSIGVEHKDEKSIATAERAFLDTIYIHKDYHFDNLGSVDWDKVFEILPIYKNKRMIKKVNEFYKHYKLA
ncbi:type IV toxin-antitoxin system AbiEi family antitoxin domain-containing protein [Patescibacteria group bacterium]|nr:type IV toxin-antitoxin system AbiEi family antitoxin domain-containing protein [Patescibacteria group bacterium]MBU4017475.1 type IV toxin-antitoxin system AbiEi family antitoxin domain-containing protein [Patescibacteria group bacterium]MBU4099726.1 type IV toxin-antitoxin system AbiEi family antitoxin domain-containing protein [Patescibacteria group bacterium]